METKWLTCETANCPGEWVPIVMEIPDGSNPPICGACMQLITNIADLQPEEGRVLPAWILQMLQTQNSGN